MPAWLQTVVTLIAVTALPVACGLLLRRRINRQGMVRMIRQVRSVRIDSLPPRISAEGDRPLEDVAQAVNVLTQTYHRRVTELARQFHELEALLGSMIEGVLAVDTEERVIRLNPAAAAMLQTRPQAALGQSIQELVRNTALIRLVGESLQAQKPVSADLVLRSPSLELVSSRSEGGSAREAAGRPDRQVHVEATALRDADGVRIGALVVLHDVTELHRLEKVRQDFVANVSHEMKTPVTAIRGAVETLMDGGADEEDHRNHFLQMIVRQTNRLQAIVEDLLSLARLEQDDPRQTIDLSHEPIADVIATAVETCRHKADAKQIAVTTECPPDLRAKVNVPLLEQAVVNLIDNAIKYSPDGRPVRVVAQRSAAADQPPEVLIHVIDRGQGIEAQHLPRIFERFYRVDRARSRALGGTGLGLSIVKHTAAAHGGHVAVESAPGVGSTFTLHLPG
jgi:two-component system phosphate regulon sensor histidine kinase PhoR